MNSNLSYPFLDLKFRDVGEINTSFVYNFAQGDENDFDILKKSAKLPTNELIQITTGSRSIYTQEEVLNGTISIGVIPRYVLLTVDPLINKSGPQVTVQPGFISGVLAQGKLVEPFEPQTPKNPFTFFNMHDFDIESRVAENFSGIVDIGTNVSTDEYSTIVTNSLLNKGFTFNGANKSYKSKFFENLSKVKQSSLINDSYVADILNTAEKDPAVQFDIASAKILTKGMTVSPDLPPRIQDYHVNFDLSKALNFQILKGIGFHRTPSEFEPVVSSRIGFLIKKTEIETGKILLIPIDSPAEKISFIDRNVAYNKRYFYSLQTVNLVSIYEKTGDTLVHFTVLGPPNNTSTVNCVDLSPPLPPTDIDFIWDDTNKRLAIYWNFPISHKKNITAFQIFKRNDVNESFNLLAQLTFDKMNVRDSVQDDFNYNLIPSPGQSPRSITFFYDENFNINSKQIYALCSVDRQGTPSNYSMQFEISFDRYKNNLNKKFISISGAPRQYPNMYVEDKAVVQSMKSAGKFKMKMIFNPEIYQLSREADDPITAPANEQVVAYSTRDNLENKYQIQIINTDLQQQKLISANVLSYFANPILRKIK